MCRKTTCFKENIFDRHRAMRQGTFRYRWANRCFWKRFKWPGLLGRNGLDQWCPVGPPPHRLKLVRRLIWVTNGRADNKSDTSEVPQLTDPLCATRKSAESYVSAYSTGDGREPKSTNSWAATGPLKRDDNTRGTCGS
jgi:hypothetical protein